MSNIKQYEISEWSDNKAVFVVDHDKATDDFFHLINNFFSDAESRLVDEDGNVVIAVLKMIANECFVTQVASPMNNYGIMAHFGTDNNGRSVEGFPPLDGSLGVLLTSVDCPEFTIDKEVKVVQLEVMPPKPEIPSF